MNMSFPEATDQYKPDEALRRGLYETPILLRGYHPDYNRGAEYRAAKTPIPSSIGYTKDDYVPPSDETMERHRAAGGWIGHRVPQGHHILDIEDPETIAEVRAICRRHNIAPAVNHTNNGVQIVFSLPQGEPIPGSTRRFTRAGFSVTDRAAGKNYAILPPTNGRTWENKEGLLNSKPMPEELLPARNTMEDQLNVLAWVMGAAYRKGTLTGYEDLDDATGVLLVECGLTDDDIHRFYQIAFQADYDKRRSTMILERTRKRIASGDSLRGPGTLIQKLKNAGHDDLIAQINKVQQLAGTDRKSTDEKKDRDSQATLLVKLCNDVSFFHDKDGNIFAQIQINDHVENWTVRSKGFKRWLAGKFYTEHGKPPGSQALNDALLALEYRGQHDGPEREVSTRIAQKDGTIYLNLANPNWEAVRITATGWDVVMNPPVHFIRPKGMLELPVPEREGSLDDLDKLLNIASKDERILVKAYIVGALNPRGPYPSLNLEGPQGSAKTSACRVIKNLIDPSSAPVRATPREERDLVIAAISSHLCAFDNISTLPNWLSDALCRLSTGTGFSTRALYTDAEEQIFSASRPVITNGIAMVVTRHDLMDRTVFINLEAIPPEKRREERELNVQFERLRPKILGAVCDAVSAALRNENQVRLDTLPRMADFARWIVAAEEALPWNPGEFMEAYTRNRSQAIDFALTADMVGGAVVKLMEGRVEWSGTPSALLEELKENITDAEARSREWPKSPSALSKRLARAETSLRERGINVKRLERGKERGWVIRTLTHVAVEHDEHVNCKQYHGPAHRQIDAPADEYGDAVVDVDGNLDRSDGNNSHMTTQKQSESLHNDMFDGSDGKFHTQSKEVIRI